MAPQKGRFRHYSGRVSFEPVQKKPAAGLLLTKGFGFRVGGFRVYRAYEFKELGLRD